MSAITTNAYSTSTTPALRAEQLEAQQRGLFKASLLSVKENGAQDKAVNGFDKLLQRHVADVSKSLEAKGYHVSQRVAKAYAVVSAGGIASAIEGDTKATAKKYLEGLIRRAHKEPENAETIFAPLCEALTIDCYIRVGEVATKHLSSSIRSQFAKLAKEIAAQRSCARQFKVTAKNGNVLIVLAEPQKRGTKAPKVSPAGGNEEPRPAPSEKDAERKTRAHLAAEMLRGLDSDELAELVSELATTPEGRTVLNAFDAYSKAGQHQTSERDIEALKVQHTQAVEKSDKLDDELQAAKGRLAKEREALQECLAQKEAVKAAVPELDEALNKARKSRAKNKTERLQAAEEALAMNAQMLNDLYLDECELLEAVGKAERDVDRLAHAETKAIQLCDGLYKQLRQLAA